VAALLRAALTCFRSFLRTTLLGALFATLVAGQSPDEEKKNADSLKEDSSETRAVASPTPKKKPTPSSKSKSTKGKTSSKKKSASKPKQTPTPKARKSPTPEPDESTKGRSESEETDPDGSDKETTSRRGQVTGSEGDEFQEPVSTPGPKKTPTPKPDASPKQKTESSAKKSSEKGKSPTPSKKKKKTGSKKSGTGTKKTAKKTPTPEPEESATPKAKSKSGAKKSTEEGEAAASKEKKGAKADSAKSLESTGKGSSKRSPTPEPKESSGPKSGAKEEANAKEEGTPKRIERAEPVKTGTPIEKPAKTPPEPPRAPTPEPCPPPRPVSTPALPLANLPSDITIEKSGLEEDQGLEPPPPTPARRGWWPWSRPANYHFLTGATIEAIRNAPVQRGRWKFVIVHNSGTRQGNARAFDYYHRKIRRMRNGLAYHFVIGNGTSSRNGQIEIGDRWRRQINGGHVHSDYMNNIALGICLVGDFNRDQPTRAQLDACEELIRYLQERCGKSDGRSLIVRPHREVNPPRWATDCPGDAFPYNWFGRFR
jgi:hypothetical protein